MDGKERVVVVDGSEADLPLEELHLRLAVLPRQDRIVVRLPPEVPRRPYVRQLVHHLRVGGVLQVDDVAVACEEQGLFKLREQHANRYLELSGRGSVLRTLPAQRFEPRSVVRQSAPVLPPTTAYDVPEHSLRVYDDVVCRPGQVAVQDRVLLPDTFRHGARKRLNNQSLDQLSPKFARPTDERDVVSNLDGAYFYLDSEFRGHFGHAMTEQLSRLWAWRDAKAAYPELHALLLNGHRRGLYEFETLLYDAAGIDPGDLVIVDGPVRVERLVAATPMFSQPEYVHPDLADLWGQVSTALAAKAKESDLPRRFFCARRHGKRACTNADEVEAHVASKGLAIVYPDDLPLPEQARLFREAEVVGGYDGSALFNLLFSIEPKKVVMVSPESYAAQNLHLIAAPLGHELNIAWCRPDHPRQDDERFRQWYHSDFTFDFDREGRFVDEVLA